MFDGQTALDLGGPGCEKVDVKVGGELLLCISTKPRSTKQLL